ncbi:MAG: hypothetical protein QOJ84_1596 [Bradyrhizobium sp.]|jgi:hypothetical protein|nr:hypothetical protein [Bradyrhizobium sp.]
MTAPKHNQLPAELGPTQLIAVSSVKFPKSLKIYSASTIKKAARFLETFGLRVPVLVDSDRNIINGEIWALAHKHLELPEIPALFVEGLNADQLNAYRIGMERIPELGDWDHHALGELFQDWTSRDIGFDIELPGFAAPEIDSFLQGLAKPSDLNGAEEVQATDIDAPVTKVGDIWRCGHHLILCGSSTQQQSFRTLMKKEKAAAVVTDPPYNVAVDGHVGGKGTIRHKEFAMASGEMTGAEFQEFLATIMRNCVSSSINGSLHFFFMDWRHAMEILQSGAGVYTELRNIPVWVKSNAGMGSLYRSQHELVFVFKSGKGSHRNNVQLGRFGRNRSNVWQYAGANGFDGRKTDEGHLLAMHPTVKPVQMLADIFLDCTARGEIILDPFLGSGSALIAAERVGRKLRGIEIDGGYVDLAIRRWQRHSGDQATHAATGKLFDSGPARTKT